MYNPPMEASVPSIALVPFSPEYRQQVVDLWMKSFDKSRAFVEKDIDRAGDLDDGLLVLAVEDGAVLGTMIAASDGYRGWIYYLAVDPRHRNKGVARMLVQEGERRLRNQGCNWINLQVQRANSDVCGFYLRMGFQQDQAITMVKNLNQGR